MDVDEQGSHFTSTLDNSLPINRKIAGWMLISSMLISDLHQTTYKLISMEEQ